MSKLPVFDQKVEELVNLGKAKIAFGFKEPNAEILESLERSQKYADIILVGTKTIESVEGFEKIISENPEEKLASMLANDEVDGIVRGTIDDFKTLETYEKLTDEKYTINPGLFQDTFGRQFFMTPVSNVEGWTKEDRLRLAIGVIDFVKEWGIEPKVAVLTGRRHETYARKKEIKDGVDGMLNKTYEDADWIVAEIKKHGVSDVENRAIDLNPAVEDGCNVIIPANGMMGNQIFRGMHICGGIILTATRLGLSRVYEDNSRTEKNYDYHFKWAVALANKKKFNK